MNTRSAISIVPILVVATVAAVALAYVAIFAIDAPRQIQYLQQSGLTSSEFAQAYLMARIALSGPTIIAIGAITALSLARKPIALIALLVLAVVPHIAASFALANAPFSWLALQVGEAILVSLALCRSSANKLKHAA